MGEFSQPSEIPELSAGYSKPESMPRLVGNRWLGVRRSRWWYLGAFLSLLLAPVFYGLQFGEWPGYGFGLTEIFGILSVLALPAALVFVGIGWRKARRMDGLLGVFPAILFSIILLANILFLFSIVSLVASIFRYS